MGFAGDFLQYCIEPSEEAFALSISPSPGPCSMLLPGWFYELRAATVSALQLQLLLLYEEE